MISGTFTEKYQTGPNAYQQVTFMGGFNLEGDLFTGTMRDDYGWAEISGMLSESAFAFTKVYTEAHQGVILAVVGPIQYEFILQEDGMWKGNFAFIISGIQPRACPWLNASPERETRAEEII